MEAADAQPKSTPSHRPILVTGVPRSGTTWLARLLAHAPHTALAGREPMNPRGHQFALGHSPRVDPPDPVTPLQRLALVSSYRGFNPLVYSRYGRRQWAALLPGTSMVVKDPFAMTSLATVHRVAGALPVLLVSTRAQSCRATGGWAGHLTSTRSPRSRSSTWARTCAPGDAAADMGTFWSTLHRLALLDIHESGAVVVFHEDLALGGTGALRTLFRRCGLEWNSAVAASAGAAWERPTAPDAVVQDQRLHHFDRAPQAVASGWRQHVSASEVETIERVAGATLRELQDLRLAVSPEQTSS